MTDSRYLVLARRRFGARAEFSRVGCGGAYRDSGDVLRPCLSGHGKRCKGNVATTQLGERVEASVGFVYFRVRGWGKDERAALAHAIRRESRFNAKIHEARS